MKYWKNKIMKKVEQFLLVIGIQKLIKLKRKFIGKVLIHFIKIKIFFSKLTLTRASVKLVHIAISSLVDISGYRFLLNVCSNSCNCCDVKCVLCRRCLLFFLSFLVSSVATIESSCKPVFVFSVFILDSFIDRFPIHTYIYFFYMDFDMTYPKMYN